MMVQAAVIIGPKDSNLNYGTEARNHIRSHTKIRCYVDRAQTNCHKQFSTYFCASFLFLDLRLFGQILLSVSVALISAKQIKFFRKITHTRCYVQNRWKLTMKHDKNNCRVHLRKFITICADQLQRLGVKKKKWKENLPAIYEAFGFFSLKQFLLEVLSISFTTRLVWWLLSNSMLRRKILEILLNRNEEKGSLTLSTLEHKNNINYCRKGSRTVSGHFPSIDHSLNVLHDDQFVVV